VNIASGTWAVVGFSRDAGGGECADVFPVGREINTADLAARMASASPVAETVASALSLMSPPVRLAVESKASADPSLRKSRHRITSCHR
jgi:hypothetical protein